VQLSPNCNNCLLLYDYSYTLKSGCYISEPKIVFFDIETIPDMKEAMKVWCQLSNYPGQTMKATITTIICVGYKILGEKRTRCINAWDFPEWEKDINDDKKVCLAIHKVLEGADAVVTHNGVRFDWKHLQTRFLVHGIPPLPKIKHIDTCLVARKSFLSFNNRLGYLGEWLVSDTKLENGGWELWVKVSKRIKSAQKLMTKYCKQDVDLLEKVFTKLRPFIKNLPNTNIDKSTQKMIDKIEICPTCSSSDIIANGWAYTASTKYPRFFCKNCKSYSRGNARGKKLRPS